MTKAKKIPKNVQVILDELVKIFKDHLSNNLVGIYLPRHPESPVLLGRG